MRDLLVAAIVTAAIGIPMVFATFKAYGVPIGRVEIPDFTYCDPYDKEDTHLIYHMMDAPLYGYDHLYTPKVIKVKTKLRVIHGCQQA